MAQPPYQGDAPLLYLVMCVFLNYAAELQGTIKYRLHNIILNIDYIDIDYIDHELS